MNDDPLVLAINSALSHDTTVGRNIRHMLENDTPDYPTLVKNVCTEIENSGTSRCNVYLESNPEFTIHDVYTKRHAVNDIHRISFTRLRVSGHSLAIETGKWNRRGRGRLLVEERLCTCGSVQTERHVAEHCSITQDIRHQYMTYLVNSQMFLPVKLHMIC